MKSFKIFCESNDREKLAEKKVTAKDIEYIQEPYGIVGKIPANTPVVSADNLPGDSQYWVEMWKGMTEEEESWQRNYGFLVSEDEVTESE